MSHKLDEISPEAPKFYLGDLNQVRLNKTLKSYEQYVQCPTTRKGTTIDLCYGNVEGGYKAIPMPGLGSSYHYSVFLMPVYKPCFRRQAKEERIVRTWTEDSISSLQACFELMDWQCFYVACDEINELIDTVSSYICFCVDHRIPPKVILIYPNTTLG